MCVSLSDFYLAYMCVVCLWNLYVLVVLYAKLNVWNYLIIACVWKLIIRY